MIVESIIFLIVFYLVFFVISACVEHFDRKKICDALCNLILFVQLKKCEKHLWRKVTFSKVAGNSSMGVFHVF